jgi:hypothetical protein
MKSPVFDFKSIARKLNRQEQKAEFEEKNPPVPDTSMYGWPYGVAVPYANAEWRRVNDEPFEYATMQGSHGDEFVKLEDGSCLRRPLEPLKSMAHPEWPYAGTPFEWSKFKI